MRKMSLEGDLLLHIDSILYELEDDPTYVVPNVNGWVPNDTPEDELHLPDFGGQVPDAAPDAGHVHVWRPCHEHFEDPRPIMAAVFIAEEDGNNYGSFGEAIMTVWPPLRTDEWIHVEVDESWKGSEILDHSTPQLMIINSGWFPAVSSWRGALIELCYVDETRTTQEESVLSIAVRTPMSKQALLMQLGVLHLRSQSYLEVNGQILRSGAPAILFQHGTYMYLEFAAEPPPGNNGSSSERWTHPTPSSLYGSEITLEEESITTDDLLDPEILQDLVVEEQLRQIDARDQDEDQSESHAEPISSSSSTECERPLHEWVSTCHDGRRDSRPTHGERTDPIPISSSDDDPDDDVAPPLVMATHEHKEQSGACRSQQDTHAQLRLPQTLVLDRLIPSQLHSTTSHGAHLGADPQQLDALLQPWPEECQRAALPDDIDFPAPTLQWLSADGEQDSNDVLIIYTDGSYLDKIDTAAWAWVATLGASDTASPEQLGLFQWGAGSLCIDPDAPGFFGATFNSSANAEAAALQWAAAFALQVDSTISQVVFRYDNSSIGGASGGYNAYTDRCPLVHHVRFLMQCVEARFGITNVFHQHIHGHRGEPINELADALAWTTANGRLRALPPAVDFRALLCADALHDLWLLLPRRYHPEAWPPANDGHMRLPPRAALQPLAPAVDWTFGYGSFHEVQPRTGLLTWTFKALSHNVQSLSGRMASQHDEHSFVGKLAYYRAQLHHHDIHIAGLQETRLPDKCVWTMDGFCFVLSGAEAGHGGVALVIKLQYPIGTLDSKPFFFDPSTITILHADHRSLVVRISTTIGQRFLVCVGHAPHQGHPTEVKQQWWTTLLNLVRLHQGQDECLSFFDANADLGFEGDDIHVGTHGGLPPDVNGTELTNFLELAHSWLPSTFFRCHQGPHETWYGNASQSASGKRLDFIALPLTWTYYDVHSEVFVFNDIDSGNANIDHYPIQVSIHGSTIHDRPRRSRHGGSHVDWIAVRQCRDDSVWRRVFANLKSPPWDLDPHAHWQVARESLINELSKVFPKHSTPTKRRYISSNAWSLRKTRNHLKRQLDWRFEVPLVSEQKIAFLAWTKTSSLSAELLHQLAELFHMRVCAFVGCPLPHDLLQIERLIYFRSLALHGPDVLWSLSGIEATWKTSLFEALDWLWNQLAPFPDRPRPQEDPDYWTHLAVSQPGPWSGLLKQAFAKAVLQLSIQAEVKIWHGVFADFLIDAGVPLPDTTTDLETATVATHACLRCRKLFRTRSGWAVHCFRVHGRRAAYRYQADGATCDACVKLFRNHVRLGPRKFTAAQVDDLLPEDMDFLETLITIEDDLDFLVAEHSTEALWIPRILKACMTTHLDVATIQRHLRTWAAHLADRWFTPRLRPHVIAVLHRAILAVADQASVQYFLPKEFDTWMSGRPAQDRLDDQERIGVLANLPTLEYSPNPRLFPRFRQLIFARLYSGQRRQGDLQACIEALDWSPDMTPLVLSLDIVIDEKACNIFDPQIRLHWFQFALRGGLHGLMAGPPCESWSVARERWFETHTGPRPIRRRHTPWAVDHFTMREGRQYRSKRVLPAPLTMGRRHGSKFYHTAQLKEYPEPLCRLLAACFHRHITQEHHQQEQTFQQHDDDVIAALTPLIAQVVDGEILAPGPCIAAPTPGGLTGHGERRRRGVQQAPGLRGHGMGRLAETSPWIAGLRSP
eukprot:Skav205245  [mRNA]  locus=scaffold1794:421388:429761:- [translate_table: standard]